MIVTRTPFRISFAGGGSDVPDFYRGRGGAVITTAIDKYMFIIVNRRFEDSIRVSYSKTEIVRTVEEIQHPIVRECLRLLDIRGGLEIISMADVPAQTGLGSSSSFTVGLLHALHRYRGDAVTPEELAAQACHIEIDLLKEPIGKQDQYIAAYGGLQHIAFNRDDSVTVRPVPCGSAAKQALDERLLLFWTGTTRRTSDILASQQKRIVENESHLARMQEIGGEMSEVLGQGGALARFGGLLHEGWVLKRELADGISNPLIEDCYARARAAGAVGGKVVGAGGGGFLLLFVEPDRQQAVRTEFAGMKELPFHFEPGGSSVIHAAGTEASDAR